jgi:ribosomal-protein-alanine N-acetyltransferase
MTQIRSATLADIPVMLQIEQNANSHPWTEGTFNTCFSERYFNAVLLDDNDSIQGFYIGEKVAVEASLFNIGAAAFYCAGSGIRCSGLLAGGAAVQ